MRNTKRFISLLLSLLLLMGAVAVGVTTASADVNYTVILSPGNGTGDPIYYYSSDQSEFPDYYHVGNCQFFHEDDGRMGFRVESGYYPDTFQVPEGYRHTGWAPGSVITLTESVTTFTATYGQVLSGDPCSCSISPTEWVLNGPGYTDITCTFDSLVFGVVEIHGEDVIANYIDITVSGFKLRDENNPQNWLQCYLTEADHSGPTDQYKSLGQFRSQGDTFTVNMLIKPEEYVGKAPGTYKGTCVINTQWGKDYGGKKQGEKLEFEVTLVIPAPTEISLDETEITLYEGDTQQLTPTLAPENSTGKINWSSSDESVATVSDSGIVTAVNADGGSDTEKGTATITATVDGTGLSAACTVNVNHNWGAPTYTWAEDNSTCTATRLCTKDGCGAKEEETAEAAVRSSATCTEAGIATYLAEFSNEAFETQTNEMAVDALRHDWQDIVLQQATGDALGIMGKKCSRCGEEGDRIRLYAEEGTSPSEYPDGSDISGDAQQAADAVDFEGGKAEAILQDPFAIMGDFSVEIESITAEPGDDYDGAYTAENIYTASIALKDGEGVVISGALPEKLRLLLVIPEGWDAQDTQVIRVNAGEDTEYTEALEYRVYDADGNFVKTADKDYAPADGETVRVFAAVWTDRAGTYALVDALQTEETEYEITFVNEDGTVLQSGKLLYGKTPEYKGETPAKAATDKYTYEFKGWSPEITAVTGNATYTATYKEIKKEKPKDDDKPEVKNPAVAIKGDEKAEVKYGGNITFTAEAENIPEKGKIVWYVNGEKAGEGEKFEAKNAEKDYKVQAKILDKSGNEVAKSKEVSVKVTYTFFDRIVIFFKDLIAKITAIFKK